ncbi:YtfJ family protein [Photobacterium iliopiscarium]|uniref:Uncharacterized protein n=1 Tax=Photobacterium iliopiscarium TaxID=56192 RepID=A0A2T3MJR8_9GAMM|nr:hypothetical protein C9I87_13925 [Photobacterium iliopiscarium]PST98921.1 hypothetical protein C9I85_13130 [Photobacterium iliopiscarium]PSV81423.1 hypothetical protein C9J51_15180 [Photobacterium iliopiscarium]PSV96011.1 hypothetical protein C9I88_12890 [Photobacterium iliopiscarium]
MSDTQFPKVKYQATTITNQDNDLWGTSRFIKKDKYRTNIKRN